MYSTPEYIHEGDIIIANEFGEGLGITVGSEYTVLEVIGRYYRIVNDDGKEELYTYEYFYKKIH